MRKGSILFCCLVALSLFGQRSFRVDLKRIDGVLLKQAGSPSFVAKDSVAVLDSLQQRIRQYQEQSFLFASFDTIEWRDSVVMASLFLGSEYKWLTLRAGNVPEQFLVESGINLRRYQSKKVDTRQLKSMMDKVVDYLQNRGYPFANIVLDSVAIADSSVRGALLLNKGSRIEVDSIMVAGTANISKMFLQQYLGIHNGGIYQRSKINAIPRSLKELPFLVMKQPVITTFTTNHAAIQLFLDQKNASKFDFLLGLLPNNNVQATDQQKFTITGTLNADLYNLLGKGERIMADFQQLKPGTQQLKTRVNYPYLFNTSFGVDARFELFKRDSTNLDLSFDAGLQYYLLGTNYFKAFWNTSTSRLLTVDTNAILNAKKLPASLDYSRFQVGLEALYQQFDYLFNPRKGYSTWLRVGVGQKSVKRNAKIINLSRADFDTNLFYDSTARNSQQLRVEGKLEKYWPLSRYACLKTIVQGATVVSEGSIYQNENYRIGGNALMRGFNEASIFATSYVVGTMELRYLTSENGYFYLFGDAGFTENRSQQVIQNQFIGIGAGITFDTAIGIFGLSIAAGKQDTAPFDFRSTKIHFGYVNLF